MAYMAEDVTHPGLFPWAKLPETDSVWVQHSRGPHVHFIWVSKKARLPPNVCFPFFFFIAGMLSNKTLITWTELCEKQIATLKLDGKLGERRFPTCVSHWTVAAEPAGSIH